MAGCVAIASNASSSIVVNTGPPKGGSNQRARTKRVSFSRTSDRAPAETVCSTMLSGLRSAYQASGVAQNLDRFDPGRASGASNWSTSALSSHSLVSGSSD